MSAASMTYGQSSPSVRVHARTRHLLLALLFVVLATEPNTLRGDLERLVPGRAMTPRLSVGTAHRPCTSELRRGETIPRGLCSANAHAARRHAGEASRRAQARFRATGDPQALQTLALVEILWGDGGGNSLQRAISYFQNAAARSPRPAPILADLAAAHLMRAERAQNARDLMVALETSQRALTLDPGNPAALFNRALALEMLRLSTQAAAAWERYAVADSTTGWAREAHTRARGLRAQAVAASTPAANAAQAQMERWVLENLQRARLEGWDRVLGEWGHARLAGDSARAADRLRLAERLGEVLARHGGDRTLADAVASIRARAADTESTGLLARAHQAYTGAAARFGAGDYEAAREQYASVLAMDAPSPVLMQWAAMLHAAAGVLIPGTKGVNQALGTLASRVDTLRHPALAGRVHWARGTALLRAGTHQDALEASLAAARHLDRAGEVEHLGGAWYLRADVEQTVGAVVAAYASVHHALTLLQAYPGSVWRCNALSVAARITDSEGLLDAAAVLQDERVAQAERTRHVLYVTEARLGRAKALTRISELSRARADVQASLGRMDSVPPLARRWLTTDLRFARAALLVQTNPAGAVASLDSVLSLSADSLTAQRRLTAFVARAEARLATGDRHGAAGDLASASNTLAKNRESIRAWTLRASLLQTARGVFDRLAMLRVQAGDTVGALTYLERGRASFGPRAAGTNEGEAVAGRWKIPAGTVALDYAMVEDTLLLWTIVGNDVQLLRRTVSRAELRRVVGQLHSALEMDLGPGLVQPDLAFLYDLLVRPVRDRLGLAETPLVLVTDGEIAGVPFSALYDRARGRYLVEDHPLRYAGSLADASRPLPRWTGRDIRALLVADPAFDPRAFPELSRLAGARAEVDSLARQYPGARVLAGTGARGDTVNAALRGANVLHFAGHAVFDDARPERSFLLLANEPGSAVPGRLTAAQMDTMHLEGMRLVVLSACQTLPSREGRMGGFDGFAGALLNAGAGGVLGSLWQVRDGSTGPLMREFHRAYGTSGDAAGALRQAQLNLLRSPYPALRSPSGWAGFRYAGN